MKKNWLLALALLAWQPSSFASNDCRSIYQSTMQYYQKLAQYLPKGFEKQNQTPSHQILSMNEASCSNPDTMQIFQRVLSVHGGKIGVLLPLSQWSKTTQERVIRQIKSYVSAQGFDAEKMLVWYDTAGKLGIQQSQLAQLVFKHQVSIVIGGITQGEAHALSQWGHALRLPTIVLNRRQKAPLSRYVFRVGPNAAELASALARHAEAQGYKRIAVMIPQNSKDGNFADAFQGKFETLGPYIYNPYDFSSIEQQFRTMFRINDESRAEEKMALLESLKEQAKTEGVAFDSRSLMLPPEVDFDALLIVDHFKNVKHLAKSLSYFGVKRLPLLGIPKWRAPEIIEKTEDNLRGAVFVDFVGSYNQLPYGIQADLVYNENFAEGSEASAIDIQIVLSHAMDAAVQALKVAPRQPRHALVKGLETAAPRDPSFFGQARIFRPNHENYWPQFLYSVGNGNLQALSLPRTKSPTKKM